MTAAPPPTDPKQAAQGCAILLVAALLIAGLFYACRPKPRPPTYTDEKLASFCKVPIDTVYSLTRSTKDQLQTELKTKFYHEGEGISAAAVLMLDEAEQLHATNPNAPIDCPTIARKAVKTAMSNADPYMFVLNASRRYTMPPYPYK